MVRGRLEYATHEQVIGWAYDPDAPERRLEIEILDGSDVLLRLSADIFRQDLLDAGLGDGKHKFTAKLAAGALPLPVHVLWARVAGTQEKLAGGPFVLADSARNTPDTLAPWLEPRIDAVARNARSQSELEPMIAALVNGLGALLQRSREIEQGAAAPQAGSWSDLPHALGDTLKTTYPQLSPLHVPHHRTVTTSVIVALTGSILEGYACLSALLQAPPRQPYEIIVVDGSGAADTLLLPFVAGRNATVLRAGQARPRKDLWLQGARMARAEHLVLMDARVLVRAHALSNLVETLSFVGEGGVVGARLLAADGRLLEAGEDMDPFGERRPLAYAAPLDAPYTRVLAPARAVSPQIMAMSKTTLASLPPSAIDWGPLADSALMLEARQAGASLYVQGCADVTLVNRPDPVRRMRPDLRRVFLNHFAEELLPLSSPPPAAKGRILFYDLKWPTPDEDAGSLAALGHAVALRALGYTVEFVALHGKPEAEDPGRPLLMRGIEAQSPSPYPDAQAHLAARGAGAAAIYFHRVEVAEPLLPVAAEHAPGVPTLFSVADLHYLRMERQAALAPETLDAAACAAMKTRELDAMTRASAVITHSPVEAEAIRAVLPEAKVHVVGWPYAVRDKAPGFAARKGIGFIGGFLHTPNVDAAQHIVADILPALRDKLPEAEVLLAGSHMPPAVLALQAPGLRVVGFQKDLDAFLGGLRLTIAPLRYGAGIKGKVLSSLAAGVPCIMSPVAAEGLDLPDALKTLVADDAAAMVGRLAALHADEAEWTTLAKACRAFVAAQYSQESVLVQLAAALPKGG